MPDLIWLRDIPEGALETVGEKGILFATLLKMNLPVPQGFIISAEAFSKTIQPHLPELQQAIFEEKSTIRVQEILLNALPSLALKQAIIDAYSTFDSNEDVLKSSFPKLDFINKVKDPCYVAVRSSKKGKAHLLNIKGFNKLLRAVNECWSASFTDEELEKIRASNKLEGCPLFIQKMVQAEKSGFCYAKGNKLIIEACFGLSELISSKEITPNVYSIDKESETILDANLSRQDWTLTLDSYYGKTVKKTIPEQLRNTRVLTDFEIQNILKLKKKLDEMLGPETLLEFAIEKNKIFIINLKEYEPEKKEGKEMQQISQKLVQEEQPVDSLDTVTEVKTYLNTINQEQLDLASGYLISLKDRFKNPLSILNQDKAYFNQEISQQLTKLAQTGKPVWYCTLDIEPELRGIRYALEDKTLLLAEFEAIKQAHDAGFTDIGVAIAHLTTPEQVKEVKRILLESDLVAQENIDFGVVIDNPAAAFYTPQLCELIDFLCIDLDTLIEQVLGIQKQDSRQEKYLEPFHPAIVKQIKEIAQECKNKGVEVSILTDLIHPELIDLFVRIGFDSIITKPEEIKNVKLMVLKAERKLLLKVARDKQNV